jgi:NAD(P)H dehydrogenase (quinone)
MKTGHQDPIRHLVVLGHPAPSSFNRAVADIYCETVRACGQRAELRDIYALGFDPLLKDEERPGRKDFRPAADVQAELDCLAGCAVVTMIYPIWFGMPPAIIKGYVDRVLGAGFLARDIKTGNPNPLLHNKRLMLFSSSASTRPWLEEQGQWVGLRQAFETYLSTIFGMAPGEHVHFDAIVEGLKPRFVEENLASVRERTRALCAAMLSQRHRRALERSGEMLT